MYCQYLDEVKMSLGTICESRNKKETKGKVPQCGKEKLRYETKEGSYLSEKEKLLLLFVRS